MTYVSIVGLLAVMQYMIFGTLVGRARSQYNVPAPAITGHEVFERVFRVHQNTGEQLLAFLPGLWAFGAYVNAPAAAIIGLIYIVGRVLYYQGYVSAAEKRAPGAIISFLASVILVLGGLIGASLTLL